MTLSFGSDRTFPTLFVVGIALVFLSAWLTTFDALFYVTGGLGGIFIFVVFFVFLVMKFGKKGVAASTVAIIAGLTQVVRDAVTKFLQFSARQWWLQVYVVVGFAAGFSWAYIKHDTHQSTRSRLLFSHLLRALGCVALYFSTNFSHIIVIPWIDIPIFVRPVSFCFVAAALCLKNKDVRDRLLSARMLMLSVLAVAGIVYSLHNPHITLWVVTACGVTLLVYNAGYLRGLFVRSASHACPAAVPARGPLRQPQHGARVSRPAANARYLTQRQYSVQTAVYTQQMLSEHAHYVRSHWPEVSGKVSDPRTLAMACSVPVEDDIDLSSASDDE